MPTYEYRCQVCGEVFEALQRITEEPLTFHNQISGSLCVGKVERQIYGGTGFIFKSGGFPTHQGKVEQDPVFKMQKRVYDETR